MPSSEYRTVSLLPSKINVFTSSVTKGNNPCPCLCDIIVLCSFNNDDFNFDQQMSSNSHCSPWSQLLGENSGRNGTTQYLSGKS